MKTPVLAMLLAGATAQRAEMAADRAAPADPVKPGDLEGCTDTDVTKAKGVHVVAQQALTGFQDALTPLEATVKAKLKLKLAAIEAVIAKDKVDKDVIAADYSAASAEIAASQLYYDKVIAYTAAKKANDVFYGKVEVTEGAGKKSIDLIKAGGGKLKIATDELAVLKGDQTKLSNALSEANNNYSKWETEKSDTTTALTKAVTGLNQLAIDAAGVSTIADTAVSDLDKAYVSKKKIYDANKVKSDLAKSKYDKINKKGTDLQATIDAVAAQDGVTSGFSTQLGNLKTAGATLKGKMVTFITALKLNQGDTKKTAATGFAKGANANKCDVTGTAAIHASPGAAGSAEANVDACAAKCFAKPTVTYYAAQTWTASLASKTNWDSEFKLLYQQASPASISDHKYAVSGAGCTGFHYDGTNNKCVLVDGDLAPPLSAGSDTNWNCYERLIAKQAVAGGGAEATWKDYWDNRVGAYKTAFEAYNTEVDKTAGWAEYEKKGVAGRKRQEIKKAQVKEQAKLAGIATAYKSATLDALVKAVTNKSGGDPDTSKDDMDNAKTATTDAAYYAKLLTKNEKLSLKATADANKKAADDKVARIGKIMTHMKESLTKGTIPDLTTAKAAKDAEISLKEKAILALNGEKTSLGDAVTNTKSAMEAAKSAWDGKKSEAKTKFDAVKVPLEAVAALRAKVSSENAAVKSAIVAVNAQKLKIKGQVKTTADALADYNAKISVCEGKKFDQFQIDVKTKETERSTTLKAIEKLIDTRKTYAHGVTGGRCEKPQSNGDRLRRGKCASDADCCGAATGSPNGATGALVTIEVCQEKTAKTWGYVAPRAPLATTDPAPKSWPFKCIDGASKLAGAAAAVLASTYMMA